MNASAVLGLDIGGSSTKYRLSSADEGDGLPDSLRQGSTPTPAEEPLAGLASLARRVAVSHQLTALTIAVPGVVDERAGTVLLAANIPTLNRLPLGPRLSEMLEIPVSIVNDGRAAAIGEARWGAGRSETDVFMLALGTGIAGSRVVAGAVDAGAHGRAGELGHVVIDPGGELCSCGQRGCLETRVGAPALARAWRTAGGSGDAAELFAAFERGDPHAAVVVEDAASALADAILVLLAVTDPGVIVIGGGLAQSPSRIVTLAADRVTERATFHRVPAIVPAALGPWAGAVGAAAEARMLGRRSARVPSAPTS